MTNIKKKFTTFTFALHLKRKFILLPSSIFCISANIYVRGKNQILNCVDEVYQSVVKINPAVPFPLNHWNRIKKFPIKKIYSMFAS